VSGSGRLSGRFAGLRHWRLPWRSTSGRIALLHVSLSLACTLPILLYVYREIDSILLAAFARPLEFRQSNLEKHFRLGGVAELQVSVASRAERAHRDQTAILLVDQAGRKLAGNLVSWPEDLPVRRAWRPALLQRDGVNRPEEFLVSSIRLPTGHALLLGGLLDNRADMHTALLLALTAAFALAIPIGLLGSFFMVREMNRMVAAIADIGEDVGAGNLGRRAPADGSGDPVDRLKTTLNAMLDRIEALVEEHRVLTDALAHDLRSPLARIHMQVTGASRVTDDCGHATRFAGIAQELDGILHMLEGALEISRAEAGIGRAHFEEVDLAAMLRDLAEIYEPLATSEGLAIRLRVPDTLTINGNRVLLARAVSNLVDNAIKYGADGGEIVLTAARDGAEVCLCVADRASGIPAPQRAEALRKFGRLDKARSTPGSGLGLTLAKAVASLHGGRFALLDNNPGLRAQLVLPRSFPVQAAQQNCEIREGTNYKLKHPATHFGQADRARQEPYAGANSL
jgi:signal transduction histidine kinase